MDIPTYKIQHVLEAYARRLAQRKSETETPGQDRSRNASEGRQRELINQISDRIIRRAREIAEEKPDRLGESAAQWSRSPVGYRPVFTYDEVTPDGRRVARTLSLDDAVFLAQDEPGNEEPPE